MILRVDRATACVAILAVLTAGGGCGDDGSATTTAGASTTGSTSNASSATTDDDPTSTSTADGGTTTSSGSTSEGDDGTTTGSGEDSPLVIGTAQPIDELNTAANEDQPAVRTDGLELYFTREDGGGLEQLFRTDRAATTDVWGPAVAVAELASTNRITAPELSLDGLTMTVTSDASGDLDLLITTRPDLQSSWSAPVLLSELNTPFDETNGHLTDDGFAILFCSSRLVGQPQLFRADRDATTDPFGSPEHIVAFSNVEACDPWFDAPLGVVIFAGGIDGAPGDLFATRLIGTQAQAPVGLDAVNTAEDERSPWMYLAPDFEGFLYFSRAGDLYRAPVQLAPQ
jgi:hypothetical protein